MAATRVAWRADRRQRSAVFGALVSIPLLAVAAGASRAEAVIVAPKPGTGEVELAIVAAEFGLSEGRDLGSGLIRFRLASGEEIEPLLAQLRQRPELRIAERDRPIQATGLRRGDVEPGAAGEGRQAAREAGAQAVAGLAQDAPDLPVFAGNLSPLQWDNPVARYFYAFVGSPAVVVAIVDSGVRETHADLQGAIWVNGAEVPGDGVDNDGNGLADDVLGWNFVAGSPDIHDDRGTGTALAGVIAARADRIGTRGLAAAARVMVLKAFDADGLGSVSGVVEAIGYAIDQGAWLIVLSVADGSSSPALDAAIAAAGDRGATVFVPAGDEGLDLGRSPRFPCASAAANVICAAAVPQLPRRGRTDPPLSRPLSDFANYGEAVDLAAPGDGLVVLDRFHDRNYLCCVSGSGLSAAVVAGYAALIHAQDPASTPAQLRQRLSNGVVIYHGLRVATGGEIGIRSIDYGDVPAAPTDLRAEVSDPGPPPLVRLTWTDNADDELSYFVRQRIRDSSGSAWGIVAALPPDTTEGLYQTSGITEGLTFQYFVEAARYERRSRSEVVEVTMPVLAPTDLAAERVGSGGVRLTWTSPVFNVGRIEVQRDTEGAAVRTLVDNVMGSPFLDESAPSGRLRYRVRRVIEIDGTPHESDYGAWVEVPPR